MPLRKRVRPSHVVIGIGVAVALFTAASGIVAAFTQFKSDSSVTRAVFRNIPDSLKAVFYTVIPLVLVVVAVLFANRVKNWQRGAPDSRKVNRRNFKARLHDLRAGLSMQTLLRDPAAGIMHSMIYFSFLVLVGVTTALEIDHQLPPSAKFLEGTVYQIYSAVGDIAGAVLIAGVVWAGCAAGGRGRFARIALASRPSLSTPSSSARFLRYRSRAFWLRAFASPKTARPILNAGRCSAIG